MISLTNPPTHPLKASGPIAGQIQSVHAGKKSIGKHNIAIASSAIETASQGFFNVFTFTEAKAAPKDKPRKKQPNTRVVASELAPNKSVKRRVQSN